MYKNSEGYADPTAGQAMSSMMKEYKQQQRERYRKEEEVKSRKKVYVASKYAGDVEKNTADAIRYCQFAIQKNCIPLASHLLYPCMLDDNQPELRFLGTMFGLALLKQCQEVWIFGAELSAGMQKEELEAKRLGKLIRYFDENCEEVGKWVSRKN